MFDQKSYRDTVLLPLQKSAPQRSAIAETLRGINDAKDNASASEALTRTDVAAIFAITPGMSDADLAAHLKSLEMFLNKGMPPVSKLLGQLLKAIKTKTGDRFATAQLWDGLTSAAAAANQQKLASFATAVKQDRMLGVITPDQLRTAASSHGLPASMSASELSSAVGSQGVQVCADFETPKVSLAAAPLKKELHPEFRTILDVVLLHDKGGRPTDIQVIDELSATTPGLGRRPVGLTDIQKSKVAANTRSDDATESAKKTLNAIQTQCVGDGDLRKLVLGWFLDLADELLRKQGLMLLPALEALKGSGLADLDARRILSKATTAPSGPDLNSVTGLVASGDLQAARRLLTSLTGDIDGGEPSPLLSKVTAALEAAERQKQKALDDYRQAFRVQDYARAQQALSEARATDHEDAEVARLLEQIPPAPPTGLQASYSAENGSVVLTWMGHPSDDVRYAVACSDGEVPANPKSGRSIAAGASQPKAVDAKPVIARRSTYAVFAFRQGTDYSVPATVTVTVLPPPADVNTSVSAQELTVFWRTPPQASGVSVELIKADGSRRPYPPSSRDRLLIDGLVLGEKCTIALTAHYLVSGALAKSTTVTVDATPRGTARPVADLRVSEVSMPDGRRGMRAGWTDIPGYSVDIWSLPLDVQVPAGQRLTVSDLEGLNGTRIVGSLRSSGTAQSMDFTAITDVRALLPVTWDGQAGLAGTSVTAGSAPPPRNVEAVRYGSELVVSWHWPSGDYQMDVRWGGRDDRTGHIRVDRLMYKTNGGVRIPDAEQVTEVSVGTIASGGGRDYVFDPVTIRVDAARATLSYTLRLPRGLFAGREAEATITSPDYRGAAQLVAVLSPGNFMPSQASDGQEIARFAMDFAAGPTQSAAFPVPRVKGPFWVRLFLAAEGQLALQDPPTASLKG